MENLLKINIKMLENCDELTPKKAHHDDAAYDLRSKEDITLELNKTVLVPTGMCIELPVGYEAQIRPRSGLSFKHSLLVVNSPGTIDAGYRGEVCIIMMNAGQEKFEIKRGDRVAQMVINKLPDVELISVDELSDTARGAGGFGSTGKK